MSVLRDKMIVVGVCGGIAAYKTADLVSKLTQSGADVHVVMTASAQQFISPLTFRSLSGNPVATSMFAGAGEPMPHISLSDDADVILIAPTTADTLARLASGRAEELLDATVLTARCPVLLAPAMNPAMLSHPATQGNLRRCREYGYRLLPCAQGRMACGHEGPGRLADTRTLLEGVQSALLAGVDMEGVRVLITAGPTREAIDPVRFISNRSSGKMGFALAAAARDRGASVTVIAGPTPVTPPLGVEVIPVATAAEMASAVEERFPDCDALIAAAAVADYRPDEARTRKHKRSEGLLPVQLVENVDIVATAADRRSAGQIVVGFAAETGEPVDAARRKLQEKGLDFIIANDVSQSDAGFDADTNRAILLAASGEAEELPLMSKLEMSHRILNRLAEALKASPGDGNT